MLTAWFVERKGAELSEDAARAAISADFAAQYGAPHNKVASDVLLAYIDELIVTNAGAPHSNQQIAKLKQLVDSAINVLTKIISKSIEGLEGGSTGPSPADNQLGLYKDFKQFVKARTAGGSQSEDKQKILYLEAQISEYQGYLQSNSMDRIRLIDKIQTRFLKEAGGEEAMKGRRRAWVSKIDDIKKFEGLLEDTRIKLGKARVAEAMLREQVHRDKERLATMQGQEDDAQEKARAEAHRKYQEQKKRREEKDQLAEQRLALIEFKYQGSHNHAAAAAAAAPKRRGNQFVDDEAVEMEHDAAIADYE